MNVQSRRIITNLIALVLFFSFYSLETTAAKRLEYIKFDQIPVNITQGKYKGEGVTEKSFEIIKREVLSDFDIQEFWVNQKRFNLEAKEGNNCYIGWKTFPQYRIFSKPLFIWFPMGIIAHKDSVRKFGPLGSVLSLEELIRNHNLKLGLIRDFAYSPDIQKLMAKNKDSQNIFWQETTIMQVDLRMITSKRIDYTVGWPMQPVISEKLLGIPNDFVFYNIQEDQKYLYIGMSCSNTETGKLVISRVNGLLDRPDAMKELVEVMAKWAIISKQWKELYQQVIIERKPSPLVVHMEYTQ